MHSEKSRTVLHQKVDTIMKTETEWKFSQIRRGWAGAIERHIGPREIQSETTSAIRKNAFCISLISVFLLSLIGCVSQHSQLAVTEISSDDERAQHTLMDFLGNLHNGKYAEAAQFYGGPYETLLDQNPGIDSNDHAALLRNACTFNGMQCLQGKIIGLENNVPGEKYVFLVELLKVDGTVLKLGPCCGEDETSSPPQSVFFFTVVKNDRNEFAVMDMPPYAP